MSRHGPAGHRSILSRLSRWIPAAAVLALLAARPAQAVVFQDSTAQSAGLGAGQSFLDAEAELIVSRSDGNFVCSGSLLAGGQYLLTAGHCVTGDNANQTTSNVAITFANSNLTLNATNYIVDPAWNGTPGGDLALIKLNTPVTSIAGYQLDTTSSALLSTVTLVGYGNTGVGSTGALGGSYGTLRYGANVYDGVYSAYPSVYGYDFDQYGTSTYNVTGGGAVGTDEAMIAGGDSGGASLLFVDGNWEIVGVHDFITCLTNGCTPNSTFGQLGGDTSVYADQAWLDSVLYVPEPASASLLAVGAAGVGLLSRRGRSRRAESPATPAIEPGTASIQAFPA